MNKSALPYCQNGVGCRLMDMFSIVAPNPSPSSIFISTYMREHRQERVCEEDREICNRHSPFETVATREYFVAGVEKYDVLVSHEVQAFQTFTRTRDNRYTGNVSSMTGKLRSWTDDGTGRVRYVVKKSYAAGENVMMSLDDFLGTAGLTLDTVLPGYYKPIRETVGAHCAPFELPRGLGDMGLGHLRFLDFCFPHSVFWGFALSPGFLPLKLPPTIHACTCGLPLASFYASSRALAP